MSERAFDDIGEVLDQILGQHADGMCVMKIGRVEAYDEATQRARVQPIYKRVIEDDLGERTEAEPVLPSVPVMFQGCGGISIALPLQRGDIVLLFFADHSLDRVGKAKLVDPIATKDPGAERSHHASDAIAFPIAGTNALGAASSPRTIDIRRSGAVHIGGDQPLVTKAEFEAHVHATAATGPPSVPTVPISGTPKLRG